MSRTADAHLAIRREARRVVDRSVAQSAIRKNCSSGGSSGGPVACRAAIPRGEVFASFNVRY
jgi:hypothetical protein